jgi:hypothetical protein
MSEQGKQVPLFGSTLKACLLGQVEKSAFPVGGTDAVG